MSDRGEEVEVDAMATSSTTTRSTIRAIWATRIWAMLSRRWVLPIRRICCSMAAQSAQLHECVQGGECRLPDEARGRLGRISLLLPQANAARVPVCRTSPVLDSDRHCQWCDSVQYLRASARISFVMGHRVVHLSTSTRGLVATSASRSPTGRRWRSLARRRINELSTECSSFISEPLTPPARCSST